MDLVELTAAEIEAVNGGVSALEVAAQLAREAAIAAAKAAMWASEQLGLT